MYLKQVEAARSAIAGAAAAHEGMKQRLENLLEIRDNPLHLNVSVNTARSQLNLAEQAVTVAEADLSLLEAGPRAEDVAIARAQVELAQTVLEELEVQRGKMTLRSPTSGLISTRAVEPGEVATAGRTLLTISNLDKVTLTVYIPEDEIGKVEPGQGVDIYVDTFPGQPFPGVVSFIASEAEFTPKNVQTQKERVNMVFAVKVDLPNAEHALKPGMPADASIHLHETAAPEVVAALKASQPETPCVSPTPSPTPTSTPAPRRVEERKGVEAPAKFTVTSTPEPTSTPPPVEVVSPTPSPEPGPVSHPSGKVIFVTQDDNGVYNLWEIGVDGADRRLIGMDMHQPDVREDGTLLVNGAGVGKQESLLTLRLDGSDLQEVSMYSNDVNPQWAPDEARLVYVNEQVGELVLQESLQKDARRLPLYFDITPLLGRRPAWIDDEHVVYQGCDVWRGGSLCGLYVARVAGGVSPWRVVDDIQSTAPAVNTGRIAYMSNAHGSWDIFLLDPEWSEPLQITDNPAEDGLPTWSPDGEWLAFLSNRGGEWAVWAMRPEEGQEPVRLFGLDGSPGASWVGERMVWVTDSSPLPARSGTSG